MNKNFYFLIIAYTITMSGSKIGALAQMFRSFDLSHAIYGISILLLLRMSITIIINPISFKILNNYKLKHIIIFCEILNGIITLLIAFSKNNLLFLILLSTVSSGLNSLFRPAFFSLIPTILEKNQLNKANSILSTIDTIVTFTGYSLSGFFILNIGYKVAFLIDAFSYFFSLPLFMMIKSDFCIIKKNSKISDMNYFKFYKKIYKSLGFININFLVWVICGFFSAIEIPYLKNNLNYSDEVIGIIFALTSLGNILGIGIYNKFSKKLENMNSFYFISSFFIIVLPTIYTFFKLKSWLFVYYIIYGCIVITFKNSLNMIIFSQNLNLQSNLFNYIHLINHTGMGIGLILATFIGGLLPYRYSLFIISFLLALIYFYYFIQYFKNKNRDKN